MQFKDYFSEQSDAYAKYRPRYPAALFEYLATLPERRARAWDCATGNGQAAIGLAPFFQEIIATDASQAQIQSALPHDRIAYRVAPAEHTDIEAHSVDLIMVAQALHWFDLDAFYAEVKRVLKPRGVLAVSAYNLLEIEPAIDAKINHFYYEIVGPYWPPERRLLEESYKSLAFPFHELNPPHLILEADWNLSELVGYLRTRSATKQFIKARGFDPMTELTNDLLAVWHTPEQPKHVRWLLSLRVGVNE